MPPTRRPLAFAVIDEWLANIRANPGTAGRQQAGSGGGLVLRDEWLAHLRGTTHGRASSTRPPAGPCTQALPLFSTSRIVAGGPIEGGVFKCALKPVATAIADGAHAPWLPNATEVARLQQIFPTGVCDYSRPDVGRPPGF